MKSKIISLFLILAMMVPFAACSGNDKNTGAKDTQTNSTQTQQGNSTLLYDKPTTWTVMTVKFVNAPLKGDQLTFKEMEKRTNVKLEIDDSTAANDYTTKLNMVLASGEVADIILVPKLSDVSKYISTGIFADLTPHMQKYGQNFLKEISKSKVVKNNCMTDDGKYYFFPQISWEVDASIYMINKPWLDKLGLKVPQTTDELYNALKGFKTLGSDIVPWTKGQFYANIEHAAFLPFDTWDDFKMFSNNEYLYGPYERSKEMKEALTWLNRLYKEGIIDKEYLTLDNDSYVAKFKKGQVGFVYGYPAAPLWKTDAEGKILEPRTTDWEFFPAIAGPNKVKKAMITQPTSIMAFITNKHKNPDKAVQYFDYLYSEEGKQLFNFGIEGQTYSVTNGKKQFTDIIAKHEAGKVNGARYNGIIPNNFPFVRLAEGMELVSPKQTYDAVKAAVPFNDLPTPSLLGTSEEEKKFAEIMVNVKKYVTEMIPKFITGNTPINGGFEEFQSQLKKLKVEEAIAIKKAQYKKWSERK